MLAPEQKPVARPFLAVAQSFSSGAQTPRQFLEQSLALLDSWEPRIGAFVCTNLPDARAAADRSTARWRAGKPLSPIDGMPVGIKDIIETVDMPTEMGSPLFAGWRSEKDAACVRALRDSGAVIIGKTVTTEFAASQPRGTRNPWNLAHTPGGSSSGSAASVAAGIVTAALGTQVIGSVVRPASFCGASASSRASTRSTVKAVTIIRARAAPAFSARRSKTSGRWRTRSSRASAAMPARRACKVQTTLPAAKKPRRLAMLETAGWESGGRRQAAS
jgi:hypothetical protein